MTAALTRALTLVVWSLAYACWVPERPTLLFDPVAGTATATVQAHDSPTEARRRRWLARRIASPPALLLATIP